MRPLRATVERRAAHAGCANLSHYAAGDDVRGQRLARWTVDTLASPAGAGLRVGAIDRRRAGALVRRDVAVLGILAAGAPRFGRAAAADAHRRLAVRLAQRRRVTAARDGDDGARRIAVAVDGAAQEERVVAR